MTDKHKKLVEQLVEVSKKLDATAAKIEDYIGAVNHQPKADKSYEEQKAATEHGLNYYEPTLADLKADLALSVRNSFSGDDPTCRGPNASRSRFGGKKITNKTQKRTYKKSKRSCKKSKRSYKKRKRYLHSENANKPKHVCPTA
jgi:hypothetical protein